MQKSVKVALLLCIFVFTAGAVAQSADGPKPGDNPSRPAEATQVFSQIGISVPFRSSGLLFQRAPRVRSRRLVNLVAADPQFPLG